MAYRDYFQGLGQRFLIFSAYQFSNASTTLICLLSVGWLQINSDVPADDILISSFSQVYTCTNGQLGPYLAMDHPGTALVSN